MLSSLLPTQADLENWVFVLTLLLIAAVLGWAWFELCAKVLDAIGDWDLRRWKDHHDGSARRAELDAVVKAGSR